jgi:hypothetical protein
MTIRSPDRLALTGALLGLTFLAAIVVAGLLKVAPSWARPWAYVGGILTALSVLGLWRIRRGR